MPVSPFAMQLHSMEGDVERHRTAVKLCRDVGIKLVRDEIHWGRVEQQKGVLRIDDHTLQNVEATLQAGIEPMIILDYGNRFYDDGNAPVSPEAVEGFARYCEFMARTFRGKIRCWEVWNEPNWEGFWKPMPDPVDYTNLLKAAYTACKKANPDCTVIGIATSGIPMDFIEGVLKAGGAQHMDVLSVHPYRYPTPPEPTLVDDLDNLRELMARYGAGDMPIWITEVGWPTHNGSSGSTPDRQADMLVRAYIESMSAGVESIFWYWFGADGPDHTYNEDNFGILFGDGTPKPAYYALQTMSRVLEDFRYMRSIHASDNVRIRIFKKDDSEIAVLWCTDGVRTLSFRVPGDVTAIRPDARHTLSPVNGVITLTLTETPCYLLTRTPLQNADVLSDSPFSFEPTRATVPAGEYTPVGIRAKNTGADEVNVRINLLSDAVSPAEHRAPLVMSQDALFLSMAQAPPTGDFMRVPAEVTANGRLCGLLEMLITIAAPASIEIVPDRSGQVRVEVRNLKPTPLDGILSVTADSSSEHAVGPIEPGQSASILVSHVGAPSDTVYSVNARLVLDTGAVVEETRRVSFMTCPRAKGPVTLDGKLDEWSHVTPIRLDREEQFLVGLDTWKGPDDCSALVYTMWDDGYFYIAAQVRDDVRSAGVWGEKVNYNDGIEFYLDTDLLGDRHERKYSSDDFQYGCFNTPKGPVVWAWQPHGGPSPGGEIVWTYEESLGPGGYVFEARIPLSEFGLKPVPGMTVGFTVALDDDDHPGHYNPFQQERHMIWSGGRETWLDPTQMAQITFVG